MEPAEQGMEKLTLTTPESASTTATDALATPAGYRQLTKAILTPEQLVFFQTSKTHQTIISFIETLNDSVTGVKLSDECEQSNGVKAIIAILERVEQVARDIPPVENKASRFGNPAFRTFYDKIVEISAELHSTLPNFPSDATVEISTYLNEAWGNRSRIDYGSGMELNFLCWLICLHKLNVIQDSDAKALVIHVFWKYIQVMRVLQSSYWLEPAGSHGVWGLDDYHFLPFLFGSAQLRGHRFIRPKAIHDAEIVEEYSKSYIYFACIQFINSVKSASLRWHSPMLDDISAVKTWDKVNSGMLKMYCAEVLAKLPVIQHFLFGSLLPWDGPSLPQKIVNGEGIEIDQNDAHWGHNHVHQQIHGLAGTSPIPNAGVSMVTVAGDLGAAGQREVGWGDCCGIPVPSIFAAAQAEKEKGKGSAPGLRLAGSGISGVRPVPFD